MTNEQVPIGEVKRDISELVNRVAFAGERIILTSRGKPKAALVSLSDLAQLEANEQLIRQQSRTALVAQSERLRAAILARREGEPIDIAALMQATREELERRDESHAGH